MGTLSLYGLRSARISLKTKGLQKKTFAQTSEGSYRVIRNLGHLQYEISLIGNPRIMSALVERLFHVAACSGCQPEPNAKGPNELQPGEAVVTPLQW